MGHLLPTVFLPALPRSQYTLEPLHATDLLVHLAVLKELYVPPIHGGFTVADTTTQPLATDSVNERHDSAVGLGLEGMTMASVDEGDENGEGLALSASEGDDDEDDSLAGHLDAFEREWAEKWLSGVVRRVQNCIEAEDQAGPELDGLLREATAVLAMMAGTSAAGSLTRHLLFAVAPELADAAARPLVPVNADLSPETTSFLSSLSRSPTSPLSKLHGFVTRSPSTRRHRRASSASSSTAPAGPPSALGPLKTTSPVRRRRRQAAIPVLLHDAPMGDHLGVGMQTWGSAILLGREMALRPRDFGLLGHNAGSKLTRGTRVLELGAGTGLLSILCRKLLDLHATTHDHSRPFGEVVATDFLPNVLDNLKTCVDLNFHPIDSGIDIAKLDWTTFVPCMEARHGLRNVAAAAGEEVAERVKDGFDLVLASDCVYDETHAQLLRQVGGWVLRLPAEDDPSDVGGTFHILSPLRPTFAPELESIDTHFPILSSYLPLEQRRDAETTADSVSPNGLSDDLRGEGLGRARGLKLGVRGAGKRSVRGRKGEGRVDEVVGYWWWEVGWG